MHTNRTPFSFLCCSCGCLWSGDAGHAGTSVCVSQWGTGLISADSLSSVLLQPPSPENEAPVARTSHLFLYNPHYALRCFTRCASHFYWLFMRGSHLVRKFIFSVRVTWGSPRVHRHASLVGATSRLNMFPVALASLLLCSDVFYSRFIDWQAVRIPFFLCRRCRFYHRLFSIIDDRRHSFWPERCRLVRAKWLSRTFSLQDLNRITARPSVVLRN